MRHYLTEAQIKLCDAAARVEECFSDIRTADKHLIDEIFAAYFLRKNPSRKEPYIFTDAGIIAVELWRAINAPQPDTVTEEMVETAAKAAYEELNPPPSDPDDEELYARWPNSRFSVSANDFRDCARAALTAALAARGKAG